MAYTSVQSGEIPEGTQYYSGKLPLGDYNFYLKIDATGVSPKIVAQCESPDGTMRTSASRTWPGGTQITGWSIEADETEASVYVHVDGGGINAVRVDCSIPADSSYRGDFITGTGTNGGFGPYDCTLRKSAPGVTWLTKYGGNVYAANESGSRDVNGIYYVTEYPNPWGYRDVPRWGGGWTTSSYAGDGVYRYISDPNSMYENVPESTINPYGKPIQMPEGDHLIARFAINLGDAGGYPGGGGGWISPGDWNIDPTTTLHLTVNGALSGRHNDPLTEQSYSYVPADKETVKGYGSGGDGGNGGGGGGGASTIIVRQFATNKANSKDIVALAKRHGYGSGGGKGGTGGDGCILIYY